MLKNDRGNAHKMPATMALSGHKIGLVSLGSLMGRIFFLCVESLKHTHVHWHYCYVFAANFANVNGPLD